MSKNAQVATIANPSPLKSLLSTFLAACRKFYGSRLVSVVIFGSVGRGTPHPDSDLDILIVADSLPNGRLRRMDEFRAMEEALAPVLTKIRATGWHVELSPVLKTPAEILQGSPLLLDMIDDARILYDRASFFRRALAQFQSRLKKLHARRIWRGNAWLWDLKPDYRIGQVFEL